MKRLHLVDKHGQRAMQEAAKYADRFADAEDFGDTVGEDLDRALDELDMHTEADDRDAMRETVGRIAGLAIAWLAAEEACRIKRAGRKQ